MGERALVMLHAPSAAGYSSPVAGGDGVVPLYGSVPTGVLDLRLLAQHVAVTDNARLRPMMALRSAGGSLPLAAALQARAAQGARTTPARAARQMALPDADAGSAQTAPETLPTSAEAPSAVSEPPSLDGNSRVEGALVLGMLHAWQGSR